MQNTQIIDSTVQFVKSNLQNAEGGHDWWHIYRVWNLTRKILETEKADRLACELGALLHDIADYKFHDGNEDKGILIATGFLKKEKLETEKVEEVIYIIENISFKGGLNENKKKSPELKIVQDADRLDAIGAIGIARTFNYGGFKNRKIYDPEIEPKKYKSALEYIKSDSPTINHFYEKLLLLKDLMNTDTGKKMAEERHNYMLAYLERFFNEWKGNC